MTSLEDRYLFTWLGLLVRMRWSCTSAEPGGVKRAAWVDPPPRSIPLQDCYLPVTFGQSDLLPAVWSNILPSEARGACTNGEVPTCSTSVASRPRISPPKGALRMRCLECGAETAEAARFCARCGAPVIPQPSAADAAAAGPGDSARLPHELAGQRAGHRSRHNAAIIIGAGCAALAAVIVAIALAGSASPSRSSASPSRSSASSAPPASSALSASPSPSSASPSPPASSAPSVGQLTRDQLQPGDCLKVPDINTINQWPGVFTAVPCAQSHTGEVFFAGNIWPQSSAYPGDQPVNDQAEARCDRSFARYVGIPVDQSAYTYAWDMPDDGSWVIGDRSVQCIAYHPGGASVNVSIKRSKR